VTDNSTATDGLMGIYSLTLQPNGSFTMNGAIQTPGGSRRVRCGLAAGRKQRTGEEPVPPAALPSFHPNPFASVSGPPLPGHVAGPGHHQLLDVGGRWSGGSRAASSSRAGTHRMDGPSPDQGKGGKFLLLPPGYQGEVRKAISSAAPAPTT